MPSEVRADGGAAPPPGGVEGLGSAALHELRAGPTRRKQAAALLRAYRDTTDQPHERAWAESELEALGVEDEQAARDKGTRRIGLLVPLSGRLRPVGDRMLEGALLAADRVIVEIGDTRSEPATAAQEAERLRHVFALVGPSARLELVEVRARAPAVPVLALIPGESLPSGRERVLALLAAARRTNPQLRRLAVLAPLGATADEMIAALAKEGAEIVAQPRTVSGARQFGDAIMGLVAAQPDAVLVADTAEQLALIAPALAAAGLWPLPGGPPPRTSGRGVVLLATAEGASPKLLDSAGRYLQGALLAPGFFPDPDDPDCGPFVARFSEEYGHPPGAWEAFAYEAVRAAATAGSPAELASWRSRWPRVYRVDGDHARALR